MSFKLQAMVLQPVARKLEAIKTKKHVKKNYRTIR